MFYLTKKEMKKGFAKIWIVVIGALVLISTGFFVMARNSCWFNGMFSSPSEHCGEAIWHGNSNTEPVQNQQQVSTADLNWETYANSQYGFEVKFPSNWEMAAASSSDEIIPTSNGKRVFPLGQTFTFRLVDKNKIESPMIFTLINSADQQAYYENTVGSDSPTIKKIISTFKFTK